MARGFGPIITIIIAAAGAEDSLLQTIGAFVVIAGIAVVTVRPKGAGGGHAQK